MELLETYKTKCFVSDAGFYCIKQINPSLDSDSIVLLSPDQVRHIMNDMKETLDVMDFMWLNEDDEDDEPAPTTREGE